MYAVEPRSGERIFRRFAGHSRVDQTVPRPPAVAKLLTPLARLKQRLTLVLRLSLLSYEACDNRREFGRFNRLSDVNLKAGSQREYPVLDSSVSR